MILIECGQKIGGLFKSTLSSLILIIPLINVIINTIIMIIIIINISSPFLNLDC